MVDSSKLNEVSPDHLLPRVHRFTKSILASKAPYDENAMVCTATIFAMPWTDCALAVGSTRLPTI